MRSKFYNFQARVSKKNVSEEDFKFLENEIAKGTNMTALAHEALTLLRKYKSGELIELSKLPTMMTTTLNKPEQKKVSNDTNKLEDKLYEKISNNFNF